MSIALHSSSCVKMPRICLSVPKSLKMRQPKDFKVMRPVTSRTIVAVPCTAVTKATVVLCAKPPASSPTFVSVRVRVRVRVGVRVRGSG